MPEYRFHLLDSRSRIHSRRIAQCEDIRGAFLTAKQLGAGRNIEIWREGYFVARVDANGTGTRLEKSFK